MPARQAASAARARAVRELGGFVLGMGGAGAAAALRQPGGESLHRGIVRGEIGRGGRLFARSPASAAWAAMLGGGLGFEARGDITARGLDLLLAQLQQGLQRITRHPGPPWPVAAH